MFYCQKQTHKNGEKVMKQVEAKVEIHEEPIKVIEAFASARTLGVHSMSSLKRKG